MDRAQAIDFISERLGERRLVWLGTPGQDARSLAALPQFSHAFSLIAPLDLPAVESLAVDEIMGRRQPDFEPSEFLGGGGLRLLGALGAALSAPAAILADGQSELISNVAQFGSDVEFLGISRSLFDALSDKPAVEAALNGHPDVATIPWKLLPEDDTRLQAVREALRSSPIVVRGGRPGGGRGHEVIRDAGRLASSRVLQLAEPVHVAPLLQGYVPVCVGACVFPDGGITLHAPSVQLIGIPLCRRLDFGYCGNDFAAFKQLAPATIDRIEACVRAAGAWLHSRGFQGAFGVDALARDGDVRFVEINPRFQGSGRMSADLDAEMGLPGIYFAHLMAWLGAPSYKTPPMRELAAAQRSRAQILIHNNRDEPVRLVADHVELPPGYGTELMPSPAVAVAPDELIGAVIFDGSVISDGAGLLPDAAAAVEALLAAFQT